jgi:hypothetical protein
MGFPLAARISAAVLTLGIALAADVGKEMVLKLPHRLHPGETAWIEVRVANLARGQEIDIATDTGRFLGSISPYVRQTSSETSTYTVPLPVDAISGDHVKLRLSTDGYGGVPRAPSAEEVKSVKVKIAGRGTSPP